MFYMERKGFGFFVEAATKGTVIKPAEKTFAFTSPAATIVMRSLQIVCDYFTRELNFSDREQKLMEYFLSKDYLVTKIPSSH
jgi:hypothetical protein